MLRSLTLRCQHVKFTTMLGSRTFASRQPEIKKSLGNFLFKGKLITFYIIQGGNNRGPAEHTGGGTLPRDGYGGPPPQDRGHAELDSHQQAGGQLQAQSLEEKICGIESVDDDILANLHRKCYQSKVGRFVNLFYCSGSPHFSRMYIERRRTGEI